MKILEDVRTKSTTDLIAECSLWKIHCVCYSKDNQSAVSKLWPVEEVIHDALILSDKLVQFVHQDNTWDSSRTWVVEFSFQQVQCMGRTNSVSFQRFPQQRI